MVNLDLMCAINPTTGLRFLQIKVQKHKPYIIPFILYPTQSRIIWSDVNIRDGNVKHIYVVRCNTEIV